MRRRKSRRFKKNPSGTGAAVGAVTGLVVAWFIDRNVLPIGGAPALALGGLLGAGVGYKVS